MSAKKMSYHLADESCRIDGDPPSKNRVVGLDAFTYSCIWSICSETPATHPEIETTDTTTVSGILYWLNRDPIGERGGKNLQAFVINSPVGNYDLLGAACTGCKDDPPEEVDSFSKSGVYLNYNRWVVKTALASLDSTQGGFVYHCSCTCALQKRQMLANYECTKYKVHTRCEFPDINCKSNCIILDYDNYYWEGSVDFSTKKGAYIDQKPEHIFTGNGEISQWDCQVMCSNHCDGFNGGTEPAPPYINPGVINLSCAAFAQQLGK